MPKTAVFTTITPLPAGITRKSVIDMYRNHLAMIDLNPLVVERYKCKPPNYAPTSEYYATWYTIKGILLRIHLAKTDFVANSFKTRYPTYQEVWQLDRFLTTLSSMTCPTA